MSAREIWRDVPGWEGVYQVSCRGRVKSLERTCKARGGGTRVIPKRILKAAKDIHGYLTVSFSRDGIKKTYRVHCMICEAFIGVRPNEMEVRHLNGQRDDNRAENLVYGTHQENEADRVLHGTDGNGEKNVNAKLTADQVREIRMLLETDVKRHKVAEMFYVDARTITHIKNRTTWAHLL